MNKLGFSEKLIALLQKLIPILLITIGLLGSASSRRLWQADTYGYIACADSIHTGSIYPTDNNYPAYPFLVAASYKIFGRTLAAAHFAPWLLGGLVPLLIYLLSMKVFKPNRIISTVAAILYMAFPFQLIRMNVPATEPIYVFMSLFCALIYCHIKKRPVATLFLAPAISVLLLVRYDGILLACILGVCWLIEYRGSKRLWRLMLLGIVLAGLIQVPFMYSNYLREKNVLPSKKIEAWTKVDKPNLLTRKIQRGSSDVVSSVAEISRTAKSWVRTLLFLACSLALTAAGLRVALIAKPASNVLMYGLLLYAFVYGFLMVFYVHGSIMRHLARIFPFVSMLLGASLAWPKDKFIYSPSKPVFILIMVIMVITGVDINKAYAQRRSDIARFSWWSLLHNPYPLPPVKEARTHHTIHEPNDWLTYLQLEHKLRDHFSLSPWPPRLQEEVTAQADIHIRQKLSNLKVCTTNNILFADRALESLTHDGEYPFFIGVDQPGETNVVIFTFNTKYPVEWVAISDSHLSAFRGDYAASYLSWDGGQAWKELYVDNTKERYPLAYQELIRSDSHTYSSKILIRYEFGTSLYINAASGLTGALELAAKYKQQEP